MRVLFTSCPAYGHALPMLPLLRAAERAGHEVRLATGPDLVGPLHARGVDARPVGPTFATSWQAHDLAWAVPDVPEEQKMLAGVVALFGTPAGERLADLTALATAWRPDLLVHEVLELAGSILAHRLGVPSVVHGFGPMFPLYADLAPACGAAAGDPDQWSYLRDEACLDICPRSLRPDTPPPWPHARELRPTAGEPGTAPLPPDVARVLAEDRPLAYVTFGTVTNADAGDLGRVIAALDEWDGPVLATTGGGVPAESLGPLPDRVVVADFVPQAEVLPRAGVVVSQCGAGTMLGALCHGVPQVALPRGTDQHDNAAALARSGAGVVVGGDLAVDTVRAAVAAVTDDPGYRRAAESVRGEIDAMPGADDVLAQLTAG